MATTGRNTPAVFTIFSQEKGWTSGGAGVEVHADSGGERRRKVTRGLGERKTGVEGNYNKTLTQREVKQLERHLSMKRTVRKKIMRDLQQAAVDEVDKSEIGFKTLKDEEESEPNVLDRLKEEESLNRSEEILSTTSSLDVSSFLN